MPRTRINVGSIINRLEKFYGQALAQKYIRKPWAWALYQTWKVIDQIEPERSLNDNQRI